MIKYGIFFSLDKTVIRLPINPETLPDSLEGDNEQYNILGIGEVTVPRIPRQRAVDIESYFPGKVDPSVLTPNGFWVPEKYINFFRNAMKNKSILQYTPVRYYEDGTPFSTSDTGFKCTVENFEVEERGGETGDFYYTLSIKEYRDYSPQKVKVISVPRVVNQVSVSSGSSQNKVSTSQPVAVSTPTRESTGYNVGDSVYFSGNLYYTSYGEEPHGTTAGTYVTIKRIVDLKRRCPYNVAGGGVSGWVSL